MDVLVQYIQKDPINSLQLPNSVWIGTTNSAQEFTEWNTTKKIPINLDEFLPNYLYDFHSIFEKQTADWFPILRPYNHAIELKPGFIPHNCKLLRAVPKSSWTSELPPTPSPDSVPPTFKLWLT